MTGGIPILGNLLLCPVMFHITQLERGYHLQQTIEGFVLVMWNKPPKKGHQSQPLIFQTSYGICGRNRWFSWVRWFEDLRELSFGWWLFGGFQLVMERCPKLAGWFILWKIRIYKWMMTRVPPWLRKPPLVGEGLMVWLVVEPPLGKT